MALAIDIIFQAGKWPQDLSAQAVDAARLVWARQSKKARPDAAELSLVFADNATVRHLNKQWRNKDRPTNILSFPADDFDLPGMPRMLGDVILAEETVRAEAEKQNKSLQAHLTHLVIHGVLHLLGYDHIEKKQAQVMEALEIDLLSRLGIDNPYEVKAIVQEEFIING